MRSRELQRLLGLVVGCVLVILSSPPQVYASPIVPLLLSPADGILTNNRTPTFDWDEPIGAVRYHIQVNSAADFSGTMRVNVTLVASAFTPNLTPMPDGAWYWHVRAADAAGNWSDFSSTWSLTVDTIKPDRPKLTAPANGSTTDDTTPTFAWTDLGDGTSYHIQLDTSSSFRSPSLVEGYSNTSSWTIGEALEDGIRYWHVRATDAAGNMGAWSATFTVFINAVETSIPTLISPMNGLLTRDRVITFDWTDETGVQSYNLQINTAADFTGTMRVDVNPVTSEFRNSAIPLGNWMWYWRVRALGTDNIWGDWSEVRMLQVDLLRPGHPVLTTPAFNAMVGISTPTFGWSADTDAVDYVLQIDRNAYFSSKDLKHYTGIGTTSYTIPDPLEDGPWYWRVVAIDAAGNVSFWSANSRFFMNAVPTPVPTLIAPANNLLIGSPVYLFDWTDEEGVDLYNIQVYGTPNFTAGKRVNANPFTSEFFNSPRPLPSGIWYWRVRARGVDGLWGDFSEVRILKVDLVKPGRPTLASPAHNATIADNTPTFTWKAPADADVVGYIIQVDQNYFFNSSKLVQEQVADTMYTFSTPLADQRWFWRVAAVDAADNQSAWSPFWSVIVDTTMPSSKQVIQSDNPQVQRDGTWRPYTLSGGDVLASESAAAALSLTFSGSQVEIVYAKQASLGTFAVEIDGLVVQTINSRMSNAVKLARVTIAVAPGEHTLRILTVKGSVVIDAFVITP